ncbi:MAG: DUF3644 domain-containing protein [Capsulimonas sp.]|uniref:DUF3644 domain-containing protein n=1 Tax=Capsulimonas sp. TaxID=2494211 RepID=UPI003267CCB4
MRQRPSGSPQIKKAYEFLKRMQEEGRAFTREELQDASQWKATNTKSNLSKKLTSVVERDGDSYRAVNLDITDEATFARMCSQNSSYADDPFRPRFSEHTERLIAKSRDAALAAVQAYNNPIATFRTETYIVLMVISFTAAFHAIFERDRVDYREYKLDGSVRKVGVYDALIDASEGFIKFRDLYSSKYTRLNLEAARQNLNWIMNARHVIEHRGSQDVDDLMGSECQSLLLNYEEILVTEFGAYYAINCSLCFPLLLSSRRSPKMLEAIRRRQGSDYELVKNRLISLRNELPDSVVSDPAFRFPIFLIPVIGRNRRTADKTVEVFDPEGCTAEELAEIDQHIIALRNKTSTVIVDPSEYCKLWLAKVVEAILAITGEFVPSGDTNIRMTDALIKDVVVAHNVHLRNKMYYKPLPGFRPQYGQAFVDWVIDEYTANKQFFHNAREARRAKLKLNLPPE